MAGTSSACFGEVCASDCDPHGEEDVTWRVTAAPYAGPFVTGQQARGHGESMLPLGNDIALEVQMSLSASHPM